MVVSLRQPPLDPAHRGGRTGSWRIRVWTSGWPLLPLRLFLGGTFLFAGMQKLADRGFLSGSGAASIATQLHAARTNSPIGRWLGGVEHHAALVGLAIALGEVAVGIGALLGLWTRAAAVGGVLLSLGFLLAVSWHSDPYYLGPDIVFAAAWTPLVVAGAGTGKRLSLDAAIRARTEAAAGRPDAEPIPVPFDAVQRLCGGHEHGRCRYQNGAPCAAAGCPAIVIARTGREVDLDRRAFLAQAQVAATVVVGGLALSGLTAGAGRVLADRHGPTDTAIALPPPRSRNRPPTTPASQPRGVAIGPASAVAVGGAATFVDPATGGDALVLQPTSAKFVAFSSSCTHAGCRVRFTGASELYCPCHGARFDASTGAVSRGPARDPLPSITVAVGPDGQLYVNG